jgi:hypothetical protein
MPTPRAKPRTMRACLARERLTAKVDARFPIRRAVLGQAGQRVDRGVSSNQMWSVPNPKE